MFRLIIKRSIFLTLSLLLILVNSGCQRADLISKEGLEEAREVETATREMEMVTGETEAATGETEAATGETEAAIGDISQTEDRSSETISELVLVQDPVEQVTIEDNGPVFNHGRLKLDGLQIVDQWGTPIQLRGVSTHGIQWFPQYVSLETFKTMRDDWHINVVRLAMYTDPNAGYGEELHALVDKGVAYATELGLYVIIDWHILSDGNPNLSKDRAIAFFDTMSKKYKDNPNVLYEICNEPNGNVTWARDIKPYAESIIDVIRKNDEKALIIVGTPTWSQDVDLVANDPIEDQENILYALHFYAATHKDALREKLFKALTLELPIIVSEFGISDASGNGEIDYEQGTIWLDVLESHGIGYLAWNLSNKNETSALINSDVDEVSAWKTSDLSPWGQWFVNRIIE